jgi:tripartite ATP-independent transporter DctP family solute receptor
MKIKIVGFVICSLVIALFSYQLLKEKNKEVVPEFVFTYAENQPENYPTTLGGYRFAELVSERTNGRIKIIMKAEGILGDERAVVDQIMFGGIDFARVSLTTLSDKIPKLDVLQLPYLYTSSEHMWKVLEGDIGDEFMNSFEGSTLVPLSWYDAGARNFYTSKRIIRTLEDIKGLNIRVQQSDLMVRMIEELGATATQIVYDDVYSALETGSIDGAENNWPSYEVTSHYLVAKHYTIDEHTRIPEIQICGQSTWNKLSQADREIIIECAEESALYERALWVEREKESKRIALENGVEIVVLSVQEKEKFREAVKEVYEEFCGEYMDVIEEIIAVGD